MPQFLLELFSEEIPARFQKQAAEDLHRLFTDKLKEQGLTYDEAEAHVTPRRLCLVVDGLPLEQPSRTEEKKGPKTDAPQAALDGFLRSCGLSSVSECEQRDTPKGKVYFYTQTIEGKATAAVLPALIEACLREMPWQKSMNWNTGTFRWVRPLHSILAMLDGQVLGGSFDLGGGMAPLVFGNTTRGHRFLAPEAFAVKDFADYKEKLRKASVILDREERKKIILDGAEKALEAKGVRLKQDGGLLEEVCGLVEWPVPLVGRIDDAFMGVPQEVLILSMRDNQKYFASLTDDGKLSPWFVLTANIPPQDDGTVIVAGNERVLRARFSDAKFFWDQDRKVPLEQWGEKLSARTFHAKLGSMADKVARIEKLAVRLNIPNAKAEEVSLAARLCKADLGTGMVGEFPELQGVMGGYYARHEGLPENVAVAIAEHYSPLGPNDSCPTNPVAVAVSLADKLDTLIGFFSIDEKPTGSKDPYALRRAALGVLRLMIENNLALDLGAYLPAGSGLQAFFVDRLKVMLKEKGSRHDVIAAVFGDDVLGILTDQLARLDAVERALRSEDGVRLLSLYRRASNILRIEEKKDGKIYAPLTSSPKHLVEESEKALHLALLEATATAHGQTKAGDYTSAMQTLLDLRAPIDRFFEAVMVNTDHTDLRGERLSLLALLRETAHLIADFSRIEGE